MNMGDIIKRLRLEKGITQEELGRVIGVQKSAIRKYESGLVQNIKRSSIKKMADYFGVSPSYLLGYEENTNSGINNGIIGNQNHDNVIGISPLGTLSPVELAIITIVKSLDEKQQGEILAYVTKIISEGRK